MSPPSAAPMVVEVTGEVRSPGVYMLSRGTVAEAVEAAGGLKEAVPIEGGVLLATGDRLRVGKGGIAVEAMDARARLTLGVKLDLNSSAEDELELVPLMRPEFASYIVERRKARPWASLDELQEIRGVGPKTVDKWNDYLKVSSGEKP